MSHRLGRILFAAVVGIGVAFFAYQWITDPAPREERRQEEIAVNASRQLLLDTTMLQDIQIVDPLAPNRKAGKVYVYREGGGWAVSGYYRRNESDRWHPYLLQMNTDLVLLHLKVKDDGLIEAAINDARLTLTP